MTTTLTGTKLTTTSWKSNDSGTFSIHGYPSCFNGQLTDASHRRIIFCAVRMIPSFLVVVHGILTKYVGSFPRHTNSCNVSRWHARSSRICSVFWRLYLHSETRILGGCISKLRVHLAKSKKDEFFHVIPVLARYNPIELYEDYQKNANC